VRQAAIALNKSTADILLYGNRSMGFTQLYDPTVTSGNFSNFAQRKYEVRLVTILPFR